MLSLLYIAILAIPLTLLALAFLIIALRSVGRGRGLEARAGRRASTQRFVAALAPVPVDARPAPAPARPAVAAPVAAAAPLPAGVATKPCPDCAEIVLAEARICKHCRYRFEGWHELLREVG